MEDFNQPSPERAVLLKRLEGLFGTVTPHVWAACQICDLSALEALITLPSFAFEGLNFTTRSMVRFWSSSLGTQSQPSTPKTSTPKTSTPKTPTRQESTASNLEPSPSMLPPPSKKQKTSDSRLPRDVNVKKLAMERDNFSCVLTGIDTIQVAYIYPHYAMKHKEDQNGLRHTFWNQLRAFWTEEKVRTWEAKLFPNGISEMGTEVVYNLISLAPTVHEIWGRGLFALKPISESDDKKTLIVQFFWQENQKGLSPRISLTTIPTSTKGLQQTTGIHGGHTWLFDRDGKKIQSGDYFKLHTNDPTHKPVPSFELLELQWFLQRIQGMAGAADIDWLSFSESRWESDDNIPSLDYDTIEGSSILSVSIPPSPEDLRKAIYNPDNSKHQIIEVERDGDEVGDNYIV